MYTFTWPHDYWKCWPYLYIYIYIWPFIYWSIYKEYIGTSPHTTFLCLIFCFYFYIFGRFRSKFGSGTPPRGSRTTNSRISIKFHPISTNIWNISTGFVLVTIFLLLVRFWSKFGSGTPPRCSRTIKSTGFRPSFIQFRQNWTSVDQIS